MREQQIRQAQGLYEFGIFRLDAGEGVLYAEGDPVKLTPKAVQTLTLLVERSGHIVSKDEFFEKVWAQAFVEDAALSFNISQLRKALAQFDPGTSFIETVPRRGFRFTAEVREISSATETEEIIWEKHSVENVLIEETAENESPETSVKLLPFAGARRVKLVWPVLAILLLAATAGGLFYLRNQSHAQSESASRSALSAQHSSFADADKVLTDFGFKVEKARAVALQPDGKIVVGGWAGDSEGTSDFAVARYHPDGSLDPTFSGDGKVITVIGPLSDVIYALTVQPDGKILAAGVSFGGDENRRFCIVRYKPDGALDASFDGDGIVNLNIGSTLRDTAYAIALQPDGKIIVAGSASKLIVTNDVRLGHNDFGLARLNVDGSLDTGFGTGGAVITNFGYGVDVAYAVAVQPDGKIIAGGNSTNGNNNDFALARYRSDGTLDDTFGTGGKVRTDFFAGDDMITSLTLQPDGKITVAGYALKTAASDFAIARYTEDGSLDNSFAGNGKVTMDIDDGYDVALGVALQADGKIVINGQANIRSAPEFALARLHTDGRLDDSFGSSGKTRVSFQKQSEAWGLVLLPEGFALSVGSVGDGKDSSFALLRVRL